MSDEFTTHPFNVVSDIEECAVFLLDKTGNIKTCNPAAEKMFGCSASDLVSKHFRILYTRDEQEKGIPESKLIDASVRGISLTSGWRVDKNMNKYWALEMLTPLQDKQHAEGGFFVVVCIQRGDTKIEERFRLVVESAPNAIVLIDAAGSINLVNKQTEKLFGYQRFELIDQAVEMLIPDRFNHHPENRVKFFSAPKTRPMGAGRDLFARRKDGSEFPVEIGLNPIDTKEGTMVLASIIDITERKKAEERFRLVVESAPNAIVVVNAEGKITLVNSATERVFGFSRNELIGKEVESLIPKRFRSTHPGFRRNFFSNPLTRPMGVGRDLFALKKDGSEFPVEIGLNPMETAEGNMVLASIIDITERKILEANRLKSDFLANMSHELRTPLNAVLGFSELLIDEKVGPLNPRQHEYLKDIHASGSHLLQLINNVLDLAKIESGKTELIIETFSLAEVVEGVVNNLRPLADKNQIHISYNVSPAFPVVTLDKNKFRQILYNLLSNAIKFNRPQGTVSIAVEEQNNGAFTLSVSDTGIGISEKNIKKLFVPFVQLDTGTTRQFEGSGLGLSLTKNIVELHGGTIGIKSEEGQGSVFWITMPLSVNTTPAHG